MKILSRIFYNIRENGNENASFSCSVKIVTLHTTKKKMNLHIANLNSLFKYQTNRTTSCT